jgi:heme/copper-type cytochrome/quinol oxidase subunit 2
MNPFELPSNSASADWLIFIAILLTVGIVIACFVIWLFLFRKSGKKRKHRQRRQHRRLNPTLAQTGGLPPKRDPNIPPPGP